MESAPTATVKALSNIALIIGLTAQIEDKYKGKAFKDKICRVKKESEKLLDMWPEKPNKKQVARIERRILRLEPNLENKDVAVYTSTALAVIDDFKQYLKKEKLKQTEILELRLFTLHKHLDNKLNKEYCYSDAHKTFKAWEE